MNVRVSLNYTIYDGAELVFKAPCDASEVTGLIVYYPSDAGEVSSVFTFADALANDLGHIDHLFAAGAVVKVIIDTETNMAFVQNAATNAYLEKRFASTVTIRSNLDDVENAEVDVSAIPVNSDDGTDVLSAIVEFHEVHHDGKCILRNIADGANDSDAATVGQLAAAVTTVPLVLVYNSDTKKWVTPFDWNSIVSAISNNRLVVFRSVENGNYFSDFSMDYCDTEKYTVVFSRHTKTTNSVKLVTVRGNGAIAITTQFDVSTVNGIAPDGNGNVQIEVAGSNIEMYTDGILFYIYNGEKVSYNFSSVYQQIVNALNKGLPVVVHLCNEEYGTDYKTNHIEWMDDSASSGLECVRVNFGYDVGYVQITSDGEAEEYRTV